MYASVCVCEWETGSVCMCVLGGVLAVGAEEVWGVGDTFRIKRVMLFLIHFSILLVFM